MLLRRANTLAHTSFAMACGLMCAWAAEDNTTPPPIPNADDQNIEGTTPTPAAQPDPSAAIVAEGQFRYRQRDVDALYQIALRHAKTRFNKGEEEALRQAIVSALIAREPLLDALTGLPPALQGSAKDMLTLDLLDYQAEPTPVFKPDSASTANNTTATIDNIPATPATAPSPSGDAANGPIIVRLPALQLQRSFPNLGKRHLNTTIAFFFASPDVANQFQDRAPVVQDAILSYMQGLSATEFTEPNQLTLKAGITAAIIAKIPDFPTNAVLIPEMDTQVPTDEK